MRSVNMKIVVALITLVTIAAVPLAAMASETVTIEGEVNDSYQIVDDNGQVYEIADTSQGTDLSENYIGEKAKVVGTVAQDQDVKTISITTFEILAE